MLSEKFHYETITPHITRVGIPPKGFSAHGNAATGVTISDDGRSIAFLAQTTQKDDASDDGQRGIFVHDTTTHSTKRVDVDAPFDALREISGDGSTLLLVLERKENSDSGILVHHLESGETTTLAVDDLSLKGIEHVGAEASISKDGRSVAFIATPVDPTYASHILVHNLETGETKGVRDQATGELFDDFDLPISPSISADATRLTGFAGLSEGFAYKFETEERFSC